jgi:23S rRNA pseudouridine2605 synthase
MFTAMLPNLTSSLVRSFRPALVNHRVFRCFNASSITSINDNNDRTAKPIGADGGGTTATVSSMKNSIRLSKLLSHDASNLTLSRRQSERLIRNGEVTLAGKVVRSPQLLIDFDEIVSNSMKNRPVIKLSGKPVLFNPISSLSSPNHDKHQSFLAPKIWAVHKIKGEVVTEDDPQGRPSLLDRLKRSGVGRMKQAGKRKHRQLHLKPIGRLDVPSEGLLLVTNNGGFAREMELPSSKIHREYRVRVHGRLTSYKMDRIRKGGIVYENVRYPSMKVAVEKPKRSRLTSSNTWLRGSYGEFLSIDGCTSFVKRDATQRKSNIFALISVVQCISFLVTCTEGKNRQIRNAFAALGCTYRMNTTSSYIRRRIQHHPTFVDECDDSISTAHSLIRSPNKAIVFLTFFMFYNTLAQYLLQD